jgi:alkylation response protein AidB-like acyl-CoA dehydrogenase
MTDPAALGEWIEQHWSPDITLAQWWDHLFDAGYAFPRWPTGLGGLGASATQARQVTAALAEARTIAAPAGPGPNMGGPTVIEHGTPEQQQTFVEPLGRGKQQWCQLFSEPGAGSDLASLATRAERDGDDFVVSGQKVWSSKADRSEWGMLLCRTDPDVPKHQGISYLMLDMRQPGVEVRPLVQMNGMSTFCEVFLDEARAPVGHLVGPLNGGWSVARTTLAHERAATAAGPGRGAVVVEPGELGGNLDKPVGELVERWKAAGGTPKTQPPLLGARAMIELARRHKATERPALRAQLVRFVVHSEVYRRNGQRLRDLAKAGVATPLDGSAMKLDLAALAHESRDLSLAILGAEGLLAKGDGGDIVRTALTAFVPSLGGGTNEIQRNIIGERALGLPREPAVDADVPFRDLRRSAR